MTPRETSRRTLLQGAAGIAATSVLHACVTSKEIATEKKSMTQDSTKYPISLAQWSLHRTIRNGELDPLDFAKTTRENWDIGGVEYVNSFFKDKADDQSYLAELKSRASDHGVESLLIMVDGEGAMGAPDDAALQETVANHRKWLEAARTLGCHSIRVNAQSEGTPDEQRDRCVRGFHMLLPHAEELELDVIIENHGGLSSNGAWLTSLVVAVDHPRLGTLPDFGNFILDWDTREEYDRYKGVTELIPYARALSAKSHDFDESGEETGTDFSRMLAIARSANYEGWVGIEYEGETLSEHDGITRTRDLLINNGCHTT
ncbi:MAG: sugar phosphate isomerase/epimerase [Phycisphaerales bacterium]|nr:sugar phosphate isomerase/epimerase [Phycisphaerales bacterium]